MPFIHRRAPNLYFHSAPVPASQAAKAEWCFPWLSNGQLKLQLSIVEFRIPHHLWLVPTPIVMSQQTPPPFIHLLSQNTGVILDFGHSPPSSPPASSVWALSKIDFQPNQQHLPEHHNQLWVWAALISFLDYCKASQITVLSLHSPTSVPHEAATTRLLKYKWVSHLFPWEGGSAPGEGVGAFWRRGQWSCSEGSASYRTRTQGQRG